MKFQHYLHHFLLIQTLPGAMDFFAAAELAVRLLIREECARLGAPPAISFAKFCSTAYGVSKHE